MSLCKQLSSSVFAWQPCRQLTTLTLQPLRLASPQPQSLLQILRSPELRQS